MVGVRRDTHHAQLLRLQIIRFAGVLCRHKALIHERSYWRVCAAGADFSNEDTILRSELAKGLNANRLTN